MFGFASACLWLAVELRHFTIFSRTHNHSLGYGLFGAKWQFGAQKIYGVMYYWGYGVWLYLLSLIQRGLCRENDVLLGPGFQEYKLTQLIWSISLNIFSFSKMLIYMI